MKQITSLSSETSRLQGNRKKAGKTFAVQREFLSSVTTEELLCRLIRAHLLDLSSRPP